GVSAAAGRLLAGDPAARLARLLGLVLGERGLGGRPRQLRARPFRPAVGGRLLRSGPGSRARLIRYLRHAAPPPRPPPTATRPPRGTRATPSSTARVTTPWRAPPTSAASRSRRPVSSSANTSSRISTGSTPSPRSRS